MRCRWCNDTGTYITERGKRTKCYCKKIKKNSLDDKVLRILADIDNEEIEFFKKRSPFKLGEPGFY